MNKISRVLCIALILFIVLQTTSAFENNKYLVVPTEMWNKTYLSSMYSSYDSYNLWTNHVQQTTDEGYVLIGSVYNSDMALYQEWAWIMKTDSLGNKLWEKTFGGKGGDVANSGQQTTDGGYILAGSKCMTDEECWMTDGVDAWLIKTDSLGNKLWEKTFGGMYNDRFMSVRQTKDGGYILAGHTYHSYNGDSKDALLIKTDSNGNIQWSKTFGGTVEDEMNFVQQTIDEGYILAGRTNGNTWLIKTDSLGNKLWEKTFGNSIGSNTVQQTIDGGYILAMASYVDDSICLIKTDSLGNKRWEKTFEGGSANIVNTVQQTNDDGYIFTGRSQLVKTDSLGNKQWEKTFGNSTGYNTVQQTKDGGYIIAGHQLYYDGKFNALAASLTRLSGDYMASVNLLKNPGFEIISGTSPQYWTKSQTGTKATFTYPSTGRVEGRSVSIRYTTKDTGKVALWQQTGITVVPSKQYKLSGYMKLSGVTGGGSSSRHNGASIRVNWYKSDGNLVKTDLITKSGTSTWTKYEKTFVAPSNAAKATVGGDLYNAAGKVTFDDLSFVKVSQ